MSLLAVLGLKPQTNTRNPAPALGQVRLGRADVRAGPQGSATLLFIDIKPQVKTIDGDGYLHLTAWGRYDDSSELDITFDVDWDSSDRTAVTVDANGVARGSAVSGHATITATRIEGNIAVVGKLELDVVMPVPLGPERLPPLERIEIVPMNAVQAFVNATVSWTATGIHTGGTRTQMSKQVEWLSSNEKVAHFGPPMLPGDSYAHTAGSTEVTARSGKITSKATTLKVVERPQAAPPPKWLEKVKISFTRPGGGYQWVVGETFSMHAEGTYSDGTTADITKKVQWWSDQPEVVIDASGGVKVVKVGWAIIHANWEKLGKSWPDNYQYFRVDVLGAAPKAAPKVPALGKLNRTTALAFVKSLVALAGFRHESETTSIKVEPTGDRQLDALLELVAEVVRKYGTTKTILEARQTWGVVMPKVVAMIKEAAGSPASLEDKQLNPARNAVNDINGWVRSDPGGRALQQNYVNKVTPFGQLSIQVPFIPDDMNSYGADDVIALLAEYEEARSDSKKLAAAVRDLVTRAQQMQKVAGDAAALEKEVRARASKDAQNESKHYQAAARSMQLLRMQLEAMQASLEQAQGQVKVAISGLSTADANNAALKELHELAVDEGKGIDLALGVVKSGIAIAATGPIGLLEVVDVVKDTRGVFQSSDISGRAEKAVQRAAAANNEQARAVLAQAQAEVASAEKQLKAAEGTPQSFLEDLRVTRDDAESAYDKNAGGFKFKEVGAAIDAADAAKKVADSTLNHARRSRNAGNYFAKQVDWAKRRRFEGENERILLAIAKDAATVAVAAEAAAGRITTTKTTLATMRSTAHRAIFSAQDAKRKGTAPKKGP